MKSFLNYLKEQNSIDGEVITVTTSDGYELKGLYHKGSSTVLAHTHGTASFYGNEAFEPDLLQYCKTNGYGFLSFNNRGAHILSENSGAAVELFSDCPKDFEAWLSYLQSQRIRKVILSGHSLGTEKIAHYIRNHSNSMIESVIFLAPSDTIGNQKRYEKKIGKTFFDEANHYMSIRMPNKLLSDKKAHAGALPMSANAYLDFYTPGYPLENALPFRTGNIDGFDVPIKAFVPINDHYNITSTNDYMNALENAGVNVQVCDTDHDFNGFNLYAALSTIP
jgi:hypothetical protein